MAGCRQLIDIEARKGLFMWLAGADLRTGEGGLKEDGKL